MCPVLQEIVIVSRMVVSRIHEFLELRVRHRVTVDVKRFHIERLQMMAAWRILPRVLNIDADVVLAFNLDP